MEDKLGCVLEKINAHLGRKVVLDARGKGDVVQELLGSYHLGNMKNVIVMPDGALLTAVFRHNTTITPPPQGVHHHPRGTLCVATVQVVQAGNMPFRRGKHLVGGFQVGRKYFIKDQDASVEVKKLEEGDRYNVKDGEEVYSVGRDRLDRNVIGSHAGDLVTTSSEGPGKFVHFRGSDIVVNHAGREQVYEDLDERGLRANSDDNVAMVYERHSGTIGFDSVRCLPGGRSPLLLPIWKATVHHDTFEADAVMGWEDKSFAAGTSVMIYAPKTIPGKCGNRSIRFGEGLHIVDNSTQTWFPGVLQGVTRAIVEEGRDELYKATFARVRFTGAHPAVDFYGVTKPNNILTRAAKASIHTTEKAVEGAIRLAG